jgi:hypothetical protein
MKGWCEDCQSPQPISPTGKMIGTWGSASYKRIDAHKHPKEPKMCDGSGKLL